MKLFTLLLVATDSAAPAWRWAVMEYVRGFAMRDSTVYETQENTHRAAIPFHKIGAVFYGLWGLWHFRVVINMFEFAATQIETELLQARIYQGAFHILWFALGAIAIAILFNWRNSRMGYWANLVMIGWTEIGLFLFFMLPGYFPWLPNGFVGPLIWMLAVLFTTLGYCLNPRKI